MKRYNKDRAQPGSRPGVGIAWCAEVDFFTPYI